MAQLALEDFCTVLFPKQVGYRQACYLILSHLSKKPLLDRELANTVKKNGYKFSMTTYYKVMGKLKDDGIVEVRKGEDKRNKLYAVSSRYLDRLTERTRFYKKMLCGDTPLKYSPDKALEMLGVGM